MAAESLVGGVVSNLSSQSLSVLNAFLADTVLDSVITQSPGGGAAMVVASGSNGEVQMALTPATIPITLSMNDGVLQLKMEIPAGVGTTTEGKSNLSPTGLTDYLKTQLNTFMPEPVNAQQVQQKAQILQAINDLSAAFQTIGAKEIQVRVVQFLGDKGAGSSPAIGPDEILFDAGGTPGSTVFAFNMYGVTQTVALQNVQAAVIAEKGSVRIEGNTSARLQGDSRDQSIAGGGGNDTLVGGGGNDTLTGGAGNDIFGFNALGHYIINDATKGADQFGFNIPGVNTLPDLAKYVTAVQDNASSVTYHFGPDASITLVGLHASDLTADMIKFTI